MKLLGQGVLMARHNGPWTTDYFNMDGQSGNMLNQIDRSLFDFMDDLTNLQNGDLYEINEVIQHAEGQSCKLFFKYTACTLKLRSVKLPFVIFGRLCYSIFVNLMVWVNGRLSYFILKTPIFTEK